MNIMKFFIFTILLATPLLGSQLIVKQKFKDAQEGDYALYEKQKNQHLLCVHSIQEHIIILEEMSFPSHKQNCPVKDWLSKTNPEFSSHNMIEIDLESGKILECYSLTQKRFFDIAKEECFILNLIDLDFKTVKPTDRRKIGPAPLDGIDRRKIWSPPHIVDGKKTKTNFQVLQANWPKDNTPLSAKRIETYFDPSHPFAYWIEIKDKSGLALRVVCKDSGQNLKLETQEMPRRRARIISSLKESKKDLSFKVFCPAYYKGFKLYAKNIHSQFSSDYKVKFSTDFDEKSHTLKIIINKDELRKNLELNQTYSFDFHTLTPIHCVLESLNSYHLTNSKN